MNQSKTFTELMAEGAQAFEFGQTEDTNPYDQFSWEGERWLRGFMNCRLGAANSKVNVSSLT